MLQPIILAAGKGTRMGSQLPKTLCVVAGRPMLAHIFDALDKAGNCLPPIVVVGHQGEEIRSFIGHSARAVEQTELSGTATAAKAAIEALPSGAQNVLIVYGDHPFVSPESIRAIEETHDTAGASLTLGTTTVSDFADWQQTFLSFGRVIRNQRGELQEIREYKNANEHERAIREVNPGLYCANRSWLADALSRVKRDAVSGEYYLTDIISLALYEGKKVETVSLKPEEALGINSPEDAKLAESLHATYA